MQKKILQSSEGRKLNYFRLSLTDRCNLRCRYCMPPEGVRKIEAKEILSLEENLRILKLASSLGFKKLRLTGGEPLLRKGLVGFIENVKKNNYMEDIRLTTNAILLEKMAADLKKAGITVVNLSLDSLDKEIYNYISGNCSADAFNLAWRGFYKALEVGFQKVKINCVPIKGINESQIVPLAELIYKYPVDVRFIEHMPIGSFDIWQKDKMYPTSDLIKHIEKHLGKLTPVVRDEFSGPAKIYTINKALGNLGFISAMTKHFCASCNRLRLTSDGKLKACLLSEHEVDFKKALRGGSSDEELLLLFEKAAVCKPKSYLENDKKNKREMSSIGG